MMKFKTQAARLFLSPFLPLKDHPIIYQGKRFTLVGYGVFAVFDALSIFLLTMLYLGLQGRPLSTELVLLFPVMALGIWLGSRVMHLAALGRKLLNNPLKYLTETGFYVQGGIVGALVSSALLAGAMGVGVIELWDGLGWGALLGLFFGRLGCFNYGCCYGRQTGDATGVCYHNSQVKMLRMHPELRGVHVHPSQLYTALSHLTAFVVATVALSLVALPNGALTVFFLVYHGISRLVIERFRGDVFFTEGRNWATFRTAGLFILSGSAVLLFGEGVLTSFGAVPAGARILELSTLTALASAPWLLPSAVILSALVFLGFGVHGRKLGTFPWSPASRAEPDRQRAWRLDAETGNDAA